MNASVPRFLHITDASRQRKRQGDCALVPWSAEEEPCSFQYLLTFLGGFMPRHTALLARQKAMEAHVGLRLYF